MADLRSWLRENVGTEARRDEVRAVVESLDDLRWLCDDMLSEHLYEYYAREDARSETVCGARCFVRERFTHVNITDVALEGTTESTRREAPGVAEREGPCAALCPGG